MLINRLHHPAAQVRPQAEQQTPPAHDLAVATRHWAGVLQQPRMWGDGAAHMLAPVLVKMPGWPAGTQLQLRIGADVQAYPAPGHHYPWAAIVEQGSSCRQWVGCSQGSSQRLGQGKTFDGGDAFFQAVLHGLGHDAASFVAAQAAPRHAPEQVLRHAAASHLQQQMEAQRLDDLPHPVRLAGVLPELSCDGQVQSTGGPGSVQSLDLDLDFLSDCSDDLPHPVQLAGVLPELSSEGHVQAIEAPGAVQSLDLDLDLDFLSDCSSNDGDVSPAAQAVAPAATSPQWIDAGRQWPPHLLSQPRAAHDAQPPQRVSASSSEPGLEGSFDSESGSDDEAGPPSAKRSRDVVNGDVGVGEASAGAGPSRRPRQPRSAAQRARPSRPGLTSEQHDALVVKLVETVEAMPPRQRKNGWQRELGKTFQLDVVRYIKADGTLTGRAIDAWNRAYGVAAPLKHQVPEGAASEGQQNPSRNDIARVRRRGGDIAVETLETLLPRLRAAGFSLFSIVRIAANQGGANALQAVLSHHGDLQALGLNPDDIVRIAAHDGGAHGVKAVLDLHQKLRDAKLSDEDIVRIAAHGGSTHALKAVLKHHEDLEKADFSRADIVRIAANAGGTHALEAVRKQHQKLRDAKFSQDDIVRIAGNIGGSHALEAVLKLHGELNKAGFPHADIVRIADHGGAAQALQAVLKHYEELKKVGFLHADIVRIAGNIGGAQALKAVRELHQKLRDAKFSQDDIVCIAAHKGGSRALRAVLKHHQELRDAGFLPEEIVRIAANVGGSRAVQAVRDHYQALFRQGYSVEDIVRIAAEAGSAKAVAAVALAPSPQV